MARPLHVLLFAMLAAVSSGVAADPQRPPLPVPGELRCVWGRLDAIQRGALAANRVVVVRGEGAEREATRLEREQLSCKGTRLDDVFSRRLDGVMEVRFEY